MQKIKPNKKRVLILVSILVFLTIVGFFGISYYLKMVNGEAKYLVLKLNGDKEITLKYNSEYTDMGATASYRDEDMTQNIKTKNNLDLEHIGTYEYKYSVKYKKQKKEITRIIKVIDDVKPELELNGDETITYFVGSTYNELGAVASDEYDGDITDRIEIDANSVDTNTIGTYKVTYKVSDSSGNTETIERTVNVSKKATKGQTIPVLNYHFFYESWDEGCHENLCVSMDKFRQQMKYLKDNNYYTLTIDEFKKWMYGEIEVPEKSVLITIDDGAHGTSKINGNHLIPLLEEYQIHATLFLITGWWDISNYQSKYLDVESHTNNLHYEAKCGFRSKVNCVSYDELLSDLKKSIEVTKSTTAFCFPFYESSETSLKAVKDAGFKIAFVGGNRKASRSDNKYRIPRFPIHDDTSLESFIKKIS